MSTDTQSDDGLPALPNPITHGVFGALYNQHDVREYARTAVAAALAARQPEPVGEAVQLAPLTGRTHDLKTDGPVFSEVVAGRKLFEIRKDDRGFQCGDLLRLRETHLTGAEMAAGEPLIYTGREQTVRVIGILHGPKYGLADGWVIMSIASPAPQAAQAEPIELTPAAMIVGGLYNWKNQPERLIYLGKNWSGNGYWHQFEKVDARGKVWCEVLDDQIPMFEPSPKAEQAEAPSEQKPVAWATPNPYRPALLMLTIEKPVAEGREVPGARPLIYGDATQPTASNAGEREASKLVRRWMEMIEYAYQCRDDIRSSSGDTPRSSELRLLADEMLAALATKPQAGEQKPVGWQGRARWGDDGDRWLSWKNIDARDVETWQKRVSEEPETFEMRPVYLGPQGQDSDAARDVLAERQRQITAEGWTPEHDDEHDTAAMAAAAGCYAFSAAAEHAENIHWCNKRADAAEHLWPWDTEWWKPSTPRRMLEKAGALILAEMERLDRAARTRGEQGGAV